MVEIVTIVAIVVGPILAVQAQQFVDRLKERRERKLSVFRTLMASRVAKAADPRHTEALNLIGIEFYKDKAVVTVWRDYIAHLSTGPTTTDAWVQKWQDLFNDLLHEMAKVLGYTEIDKTQIRAAYSPILYDTLEKENAAIRKGMIDVLSGNASIRVTAGEATSAPASLPGATAGSLPPPRTEAKIGHPPQLPAAGSGPVKVPRNGGG